MYARKCILIFMFFYDAGHNDSIEQKMRIKQEQERDLSDQLHRRDQIQEEALAQVNGVCM